MDVEGPGVIRHMWFTLDSRWYRDTIIRINWEGHKLVQYTSVWHTNLESLPRSNEELIS
jgi:hypothetical protein